MTTAPVSLASSTTRVGIIDSFKKNGNSSSILMTSSRRNILNNQTNVSRTPRFSYHDRIVTRNTKHTPPLLIVDC